MEEHSFLYICIAYAWIQLHAVPLRSISICKLTGSIMESGHKMDSSIYVHMMKVPTIKHSKECN